MTNYKAITRAIAAAATLSLISVAGCHGDFLTQGEAGADPNRATIASRTQLFAGVEANIWTFLGSDPARVTGILVQQFTGAISQYNVLNDTYSIDANTTNGFHASLYGGGGLVDIQKLEQSSAAAHDSIFMGIAQVQEGLLMGTGADLFGDLVYSQALQGLPNPKLDPQLMVYDSVQKVLSAAVANLNAKPSATNVGPGGSDLVYGGSATKWQTLAHTLKSRFYMHTGLVRPAAYASALAEAKLGIMSDGGNFFAPFVNSSSQQNFYYQLTNTAGRGGYLTINEGFDKLLESRNDPRRTQYFQIDTTTDLAVQLSATRFAPDYPQVFVSYDENTLRWAESAYRTGDQGTALVKLNQERAHNNIPAESAAKSSGLPLLNEILIEEYIAYFQLGIEPWNLYKRTCTPNLVPAAGAKGGASGGLIPGRLFYDTSEINTDTSYPPAGNGVNGYRNANDPSGNRISDGTGAACLGH